MGVTVQSQGGLDPLLAAIAALTTAAGGFLRTTGSDTVAAQAIVGTVSQSGGTPTGAIIEQGSNANGNYVKLADGTMICWGEKGSRSTDINSSGTTSGVFFSALQSVTFPATFAAAPKFVIHATVGNLNWTSVGSAPTTTGASYYLIAASSETARTCNENWHAIGRWY